MTKARKVSGLILQIADGKGGMATVVDQEPDDDVWPFRTSIAAPEADEYMAQLNAEATERNWLGGTFSQLERSQTLGTITYIPDAANPSLRLIATWERQRGGALDIQAKTDGASPEQDLSLLEFFEAVAARVREKRRVIAHRQAIFQFDGLRWDGELWLSDDLRLGPPSKFPDAILGPQVTLVDARVSGIGPWGGSVAFESLARELRLFLSSVLGIRLELSTLSNGWVTILREENPVGDCKLCFVGYVEPNRAAEFPTRGKDAPLRREAVVRPDLGRYGIHSDDVGVKIPNDIEQLWEVLQSLSPERKAQFLDACNAHYIAQSQWPSQRTAFATFLVIAIEALKPRGKKYDDARVYDVVASLLGTINAQALENSYPAPQRVRSKHVHRGQLALEDVPSLIGVDPFRDPSFDEMLRLLSRTARMCLIEWLRLGGTYKLLWHNRQTSTPKRNAKKTLRPSKRP